MFCLMASKISSLLDPKLLRIVQLFLKNPGSIYHLQKISQETKIPLGTTFRLVNKLLNKNIIVVLLVGKLKLYKLNIEFKDDLEILK